MGRLAPTPAHSATQTAWLASVPPFRTAIHAQTVTISSMGPLSAVPPVRTGNIQIRHRLSVCYVLQNVWLVQVILLTAWVVAIHLRVLSCICRIIGAYSIALLDSIKTSTLICAQLVILPVWPALMGPKTTVLLAPMMLEPNTISSSGRPYALQPAQLASISMLPTPIPASPVMLIVWDAQCRQPTAPRTTGAIPIFSTTMPPTHVSWPVPTAPTPIAWPNSAKTATPPVPCATAQSPPNVQDVLQDSSKKSTRTPVYQHALRDNTDRFQPYFARLVILRVRFAPTRQRIVRNAKV